MTQTEQNHSTTHSMEPVLDESPVSVIFVDDEDNILSALKRATRKMFLQTRFCNSPEQALEQIRVQPPEIIITDMRMPHMNGVQFLEGVEDICPGRVKILLTGQADQQDTIDAINHGKIFKYIQKPWNDAYLKQVLESAISIVSNQREKEYLFHLTRYQKAELAKLNQQLEKKVEARTAELKKSNSKLREAGKKLEDGFLSVVKMYLTVLGQRHAETAEHSRRVAKTGKEIAERLGLDTGMIHQVLLAGLMHDVGKMVLPDALLNSNKGSLSAGQERKLEDHVSFSEMALSPMGVYPDIAMMVRHHHEKYDGSGYPDKLAGADIPLGARILRIANDFDQLCHGKTQPRVNGIESAIKYMCGKKGEYYDPAIVHALAKMHGSEGKTDNVSSRSDDNLTSSRLKPGMKLIEDVVTPQGMLLYQEGDILTPDTIQAIRYYETRTGQKIQLRVGI